MAGYLLGEQPAFPDGPPDWPPPNAEVVASVHAALHSGDWGKYHGECVRRLESLLAEHFQAGQATTCCSGTIAVELALRAAGVQPGDEVILAAYDFPGNFRAIEAVGATPVLADLAANRWTLSVEAMEPAWSPQTRALIVSHLHGDTAPIQELVAEARDRDCLVIEDACQAPGAIVDGRPLGGWGDIGVLSFGGSKLLTAGRGGAVLTHDARALQRLRVAYERGNHAFPLSELQAAALAPQLDGLADATRLRAENVERILAAVVHQHHLTSLAPWNRNATARAFYKLAFRAASPECRDRLSERARREGVALDPGFRGFAQRTARRCRKPAPLPNAEAAAAKTLVLHHPILLQPKEKIDRLIEVLQALEAWIATDAG